MQFEPSAIKEIARIAYEINCTAEDIGARRLHTVLEKLMEEIAFDPHSFGGDTIIVDAQYVQEQLGSILQNEDLNRYIL